MSAETNIAENLDLGIILSSIDAEDSANDTDKIAVTATYSF